MRQLQQQLKEAEERGAELVRLGDVERQEALEQAAQTAQAAWAGREAEMGALLQRAQEEGRAASRATAASQVRDVFSRLADS